jgi:hypothetical protein
MCVLDEIVSLGQYSTHPAIIPGMKRTNASAAQRPFESTLSLLPSPCFSDCEDRSGATSTPRNRTDATEARFDIHTAHSLRNDYAVFIMHSFLLNFKGLKPKHYAFRNRSKISEAAVYRSPRLSCRPTVTEQIHWEILNLAASQRTLADRATRS